MERRPGKVKRHYSGTCPYQSHVLSERSDKNQGHVRTRATRSQSGLRDFRDLSIPEPRALRVVWERAFDIWRCGLGAGSCDLQAILSLVCPQTDLRVPVSGGVLLPMGPGCWVCCCRWDPAAGCVVADGIRLLGNEYSHVCWPCDLAAEDVSVCRKRQCISSGHRNSVGCPGLVTPRRLADHATLIGQGSSRRTGPA
eukprot:366399-Chlamydomonas_euryale.AAC.12